MKLPKWWGTMTEPSNILLQIAKRVARNVLIEKDVNELLKI